MVIVQQENTTMNMMKFEWVIARTQAHLYADGVYSGISVSLRKCTPSPEILKAMNLPPLPSKREG